ncbi:calcium-binding protein [Jiella marina]|uniref:calcium-binding protein n=1 Tax=Jiella sp. LLJ827 TaxID=2917712 RepID=UPI0026ED7D97|nr:calcium-binding protein [Jiella sp. LLJ827]
MANEIISSDSSIARTLSAGDELIVTQDSTLTTFDPSAPITTTGGANQIAILGGLVGLGGRNALTANGNSFLQFTVGSQGNVISTNNTAIDVDNLTSALEFSNAGTVQGDTDAVRVTGGTGVNPSVEFVNTGTVAASGDALDVNSAGTVYASNGDGASIVSSNQSALEISATRFELTNAGSIQASSAAIAVYPNSGSGVPVYIFNDGSIQSSNADGIFVSTGNNTTIENNGLIAGENEGIQLANGIGVATLTNTGTISGSTGYGVYVNDQAVEINNTGEIVSTDSVGILIQDTQVDPFDRSYLTNSGTISSRYGIFSVQVTGDSPISVVNTGLITGAVDLSDGNDFLNNTGDIGSNVYLDAGNDMYNGFGDSHVQGGIYGDEGDDVIVGGHNSDVLYGGSENDQLFGGLGDDELYGGSGSDILRGGAGGDIVNGGDGFDQANYENSTGGVAVDLRNGGAFGGHAAGDVLSNIESLVGSAFDDTLNGNSGVNILRGEGGNDFLRGFAGNDDLRGGDGNDEIIGDLGFDTITGGAGNDTLTGGINGDTFVYANGFGQDTITDFEELNDFEKIDLSAVTAITDFADLAANHLTQSGANAVITDGANTITLNNVNVADLDANDFIF